jgi:uncharacterized membrane protein YtjA (UPF0391 family)
MLGAAFIFLFVAIVAGFLVFFGVFSIVIGAAKIIAIVFLVMFIVSLFTKMQLRNIER